ncbi:MAG: hypothetical protein ACR2K5_16770 [Pseudolabrys sp.]
MITETGSLTVDDSGSALSWRAILAGGTASAALTLVLLAFGVGVGFSVVSPWGDSGVSSTTFSISAGIYLVVVAMLASTVGGYLSGRLRSQWSTVHEHERYFRDSAHGFLVWAFATVVSAALLGGATSHILAGASAGFGPAATMTAQGPGPRASASDVYVDSLLRADPTANAQAAPSGSVLPAGPRSGGGDTYATRGEVMRILAPSLLKGGTIADPDRAYLARLVAARTGLPPADAEKRVADVTAQAKAAADQARKSAAKLSLWLVAAMLAGAFSASLAAIEGGNLRNREWYLTAR